MYSYCTNTSKCRHVQVLWHFNEDFDEKDCNNTRDVCQDPRQLVETNASDVARIRFLKAAANGHISVAQGQLLSTVRGMGSQSIKSRFGDLDGFGEAKAHDANLIDLLMKDFLGQEVPDTQDKQNNGFHMAYIEFGLAPTSFEKGLGRKLYMISRGPKSGKPKGMSRVPSGAGAPISKRKGKATEIQDDPIEDDFYNNNMSDNEGQPLIPARAPSRKTRATNGVLAGPSSTSAPTPLAPPTSRSASRNQTRPGPTSALVPGTSQDVQGVNSPEDFLQKLMDVQFKCKVRSRIDDEDDVLDGPALQMMSLLCPQDYV